jgi:undecaprenyl-diphosphatase
MSAAPEPAPRPSFYRRWLSPEGYLGLHLVIGFVVAVVCLVAFDYIEDKVFSTHDIRHVDAQAQMIARRLVSPRLTIVMQTISMFGTLPALVPMSLAVIAWLLKVKSHRRLYAFVATMAGGALLNGLMKLYYHRARPDSPLVLAHGYSFPSGHAMGSVCFFGSLAYVVYFTVERRHFHRLGAVLACGLAALAIGASRIYLGVHYFTDVVAGFAAGLSWMAVCFSGVEAWVRWSDYRAARRKAAAKAAITRAG